MGKPNYYIMKTKAVSSLNGEDNKKTRTKAKIGNVKHGRILKAAPWGLEKENLWVSHYNDLEYDLPKYFKN